MIFAQIEDGKVVRYPLYDGYLTRLHPELELPITESTPLPQGFVFVREDPEFEVDFYNYEYEELSPVLRRDGFWYRKFLATPLSTETKNLIKEMKSKELREKRNELLRDTDWIFLTDSPVPEQEREKWLKYRDELRKVPQQANFPKIVNWPIAP